MYLPSRVLTASATESVPSSRLVPSIETSRSPSRSLRRAAPCSQLTKRCGVPDLTSVSTPIPSGSGQDVTVSRCTRPCPCRGRRAARPEAARVRPPRAPRAAAAPPVGTEQPLLSSALSERSRTKPS